MSAADPFREDRRADLRANVSVLGGDFVVRSSERRLIALVLDAFGGVPRLPLERRPPRFDVQLVLADRQRTWTRSAPPPAPLHGSGAGLLCATIDAANFAIVDVATSRALISVSKALLSRPYYPRYELVELAFLALASRAQALVPLHAACVGANGNGVLVIGASGAGKSTLCLHALASGLEVLSEDSAFVAPQTLRATGVPNYLHVAADALEFLEPGPLRRAIARSPVIERRSGARKLEIDLRKLRAPTAREPLRLVAAVFLSRRRAGRGPVLRPLARGAFLARLRREQPYAVHRYPDWAAFERRVAELPAFELRRGAHPDVGAAQLGALLE